MFTNLVSLLTLLTLTFHVQSRSPRTHKVAQTACTAVYVSPTEALTAAHCVEETTGHMWVRNNDNQAFTVHVIKKDRRIDLCLLQIIKGPPHPYAKLGSPVHVNQPIFIMANDDDMPFTYGKGIVKNVLIDDATHVLTIIHSGTILPGASGSGLFNRWGNLVGINIMSYEGVSYAVDVTVIEGFLGMRR